MSRVLNWIQSRGGEIELKLQVTDHLWFSTDRRVCFLGKEVKTTTLPKAGSVGHPGGHPENLNRPLGAAVL